VVEECVFNLEICFSKVCLVRTQFVLALRVVFPCIILNEKRREVVRLTILDPAIYSST
jgi:hypothetical protein